MCTRRRDPTAYQLTRTVSLVYIQESHLPLCPPRLPNPRGIILTPDTRGILLPVQIRTRCTHSHRQEQEQHMLRIQQIVGADPIPRTRSIHRNHLIPIKNSEFTHCQHQTPDTGMGRLKGEVTQNCHSHLIDIFRHNERTSKKETSVPDARVAYFFNSLTCPFLLNHGHQF